MSSFQGSPPTPLLAEARVRTSVDIMSERRLRDLDLLAAKGVSASFAVVLRRSPDASGTPTGVGIVLQEKPAGSVGPFQICSVTPGGAAARSGRIHAHDFLHQVNECTEPILFSNDI